MQIQSNKIENSKLILEKQLGCDYQLALALIEKQIQQKLDESYFDIRMTGIDFTGSRRFGHPKEDSDLDVKMTYDILSGTAREDDVFNCLHNKADPICFNGMLVDVDPIEGGDIDALIEIDSQYEKQESLTEDTRAGLLSKSKSADLYKNASFGKNRYDRRMKSKVTNQVRSYNKIDMNLLFKQDVLEVVVPVIGESGSYDVTLQLDGVVTEIAKNIKSNKNRFEFRTVLQSVTKVLNTSDVKVKCTCPDFKFRYSHNLILNGNSVDDTSKDPGPGKTGMTAVMKGQGCKHIMLVLSNLSWVMQVSSVINNYVHYAESKLQKPFLNIIFPKLYGMRAEDMVENDLIDDDKYLDSSAGLIDAVNEYGRTRGRFKKKSEYEKEAQKTSDVDAENESEK